MDREQKNLQSRQKILDSATLEFAKHPYSQASLNSVCKNGNISKGIIYHYFKDKDHLYLCCVQHCFDQLVSVLNQEEHQFGDFSADIAHYMSLRAQFFAQNANARNLFFSVLFAPPAHLHQQLAQIKQQLELANQAYYKKALESLPLKKGITPDLAIFSFTLLQDAFNSYFQNLAQNGRDFDTLANWHEEKIVQMIDIILFGIAREEHKK